MVISCRLWVEPMLRLEISGSVQGVGFRPFVYNLAESLNLKGSVQNSTSGAIIELEGDKEAIEAFLSSLKSEHPKNAKIDTIHKTELVDKNYKSFEIIESELTGSISANILPDLATCPECTKELRELKNRRFEHPFINCIDCGPRYSIIKSLPYDRANTSMSEFAMCKACSKEYKDPKNRRFHAEPIACKECGATLSLKKKDGSLIASDTEAIKATANLIKRGYIIAIKGIGGFHLVCSAQKREALNKLRERKNRPTKPFAVMLRTLSDISKCTEFSKEEEELLTSREKPVVLLKKRKPHRLEKFCLSCECIAPNIDRVGVFMPYNPVYIMLCDMLKAPIVVTSANLSNEPLCTDQKELEEKLGGVYDYLLDNDRGIINPIDDSVAFVLDGIPRFIRRARGYAPEPIKLPFRLKKRVLALGAEQKNTIAIAFDDKAIISPHIGDLDNIDTLERFEKTIALLKDMYDFEPDIIVCDKHPSYSYRKYLKNQKTEILELQHHYAHALSLMCEEGLSEALAFCWDGTGYGDDGTLWGGEVLDVSKEGYKRAYHFDTFRLLGGEKAIKEPRRIILSVLAERFFDIKDIKESCQILKDIDDDQLKTLLKMHKSGLNSPFSSSVGRIFDAVGAVLFKMPYTTYEGECGMMLEALYDKSINDSFELRLEEDRICFKHIFEELITQKDTKRLASMFINSLSSVVCEISKDVRKPIIFSGGVFQNRTLCEKIISDFKKIGKTPIFHKRVPTNDGGISLGQIYYAGLHETR